MKHGAETLSLLGFVDANPTDLIPGQFVKELANVQPTESGVGEASGASFAIVLDRPARESVLVPGNLSGPGLPLDRPDCNQVPWQAFRIKPDPLRSEYPLVRRASASINAMLWLHAQFCRWRRTRAAGYLAESLERAGIIWQTDGVGNMTIVRAIAPPSRGLQLVAQDGSVFSTHTRGKTPDAMLAWELHHPTGWAGPLTIVGQMTCLWAVLLDRLRELRTSSELLQPLAYLDSTAAIRSHPIDWEDAEIGKLRTVEFDLWRWRPFRSEELAEASSAAPTWDHLEPALKDSDVLTVRSAPPLAPLATSEAIDEHDAGILEFLNRNPSLRRKVSDVLPDKGPQDRKAVARRLRKLADRTPPLVDFPKDGRSGVVILAAGVEALKRATAPTPR